MQRSVEFRVTEAARCRGTLFTPTQQTAAVPCIVLANGVSMTTRDGVERFAAHFASQGFAALTFDYRNFGASDGQPRHLVDAPLQVADVHAAFRYARSLDEVDSDRLALWGFSLGGGVSLAVASEIPDLAAMVLLCPMVDGLAFVFAGDVVNNLRMTGRLVRRAIARTHASCEVVATGSGPSLFTQPEAGAGFERVRGADSDWTNEILLWPTRAAPTFRPIQRAGFISCPVLVSLGTQDTVVPSRPIAKTARMLRRGTLQRHDIGHFDAFLGEFEDIAAVQAAFLASTLY